MDNACLIFGSGQEFSSSLSLYSHFARTLIQPDIQGVLGTSHMGESWPEREADDAFTQV
jgi:hypothetical protein